MELLLNLAWLLMALPAFWLWRGARAGHKFSSLQCMLSVGCVLVILFPVISATDDLHAMRSEMEESPASKRSVRQAGHDKATAWNNRLQSPPAVLPRLATFAPSSDHTDVLPLISVFVPAPLSAPALGRAPPYAA